MATKLPAKRVEVDGWGRCWSVFLYLTEGQVAETTMPYFHRGSAMNAARVWAEATGFHLVIDGEVVEPKMTVWVVQWIRKPFEQITKHFVSSAESSLSAIFKTEELAEEYVNRIGVPDAFKIEKWEVGVDKMHVDRRVKVVEPK